MGDAGDTPVLAAPILDKPTFSGMDRPTCKKVVIILPKGVDKGRRAW